MNVFDALQQLSKNTDKSGYVSHSIEVYDDGSGTLYNSYEDEDAGYIEETTFEFNNRHDFIEKLENLCREKKMMNMLDIMSY